MSEYMLVETYNWVTVFGGPVILLPPRSPSVFMISQMKVTVEI